jgi:hypothetical protein
MNASINLLKKFLYIINFIHDVAIWNFNRIILL